ncbi:MAG TPA: cysteine--tRNA ligase, partial [Acidobacteriaceae bacterium]|nr:cysteine--tRNA ligase [Acidobacteriaceae bacterium]
LQDAAPEVIARSSITKETIEQLIAERNAARKSRNFPRADAIRQELAAAGILLEDRADGVRWRRK